MFLKATWAGSGEPPEVQSAELRELQTHHGEKKPKANIVVCAIGRAAEEAEAGAELELTKGKVTEDLFKSLTAALNFPSEPLSSSPSLLRLYQH